jgi:phosphoglycolate phosphatase-like HAD superfamily hydrolase
VRTLVLWDIDHTLITISGLSGEIYGAVFLEVTGRPLETLASMTGRTDRAIIAETLRLHGITPTTEITTAFADSLAEAFDIRQDEIKARGRELPGVRAALIALARREDVVQSVLTGNMKSIAVCKLTAFDMHTLVDFEVGAYGSDDAERPPLVGLARRRAETKYGEPFDATSTVLIGDTPNDVLAGRMGGARVVAVATGSSSEQELRSAGADLVLPELTDTDAVISAALRIGAD